ncbi:MAG TPA: TetR/AcrR family transcriptional regulator [Actinomycetota bacterium]|jgi:AcrR family transcriptional regulator|nr:TetR/AcrR family transcriptional regulator [Actinomycetota bacterium]
MTTATSRLDGRTVRRLANRNRMLDAALDLLAEGAEVNAETIAERAEVSARSVYNHFPTSRELVAGIYERGAEQVQPLLAKLPTIDVPFEERVAQWVRIWARIQQQLAPIRWRALVAEDEHPELQPEEAELRRRHRAEIKRAFPEICGRAAQAAAVAATDSLMWRSLRHHQGLSFESACEVVEETLRRLGT